ncbi:MAG: beta-lactamase family protein [Deltaproteobacteria bacterium]|nr:beta-lactamase family protein [Deltaproteobacteria bacterium]
MTLIACVLLACASPSTTPSTQAAVENPVAVFEQEVVQLQKRYNIPGMSVAILRDQQVMYAAGFGFADIENKIPATADTPYNIASLSKPFAGAILVKLVEEGRLELDTAIADILKNTEFNYGEIKMHGYAEACRKIQAFSRDPEFEYAFLLRDYRCDTEKIRVRHHLTHTAQGVPGSRYRYNGFLFNFLSPVAAEVSGKSYAELVVENITAPLEMNRTVPCPQGDGCDQILADRAKYYRVGFGGEFEPSSYPSKLSSSAGIVSTVRDLAKFDVAMDRNLIVKEASKELMFTPSISNNGDPLPYGLGWFVQFHHDRKLVWHYGHAPKAYSSLILKVPEEDVTLILLANSDGASADFRLGAGNVLRSPFAVVFLNLFTKVKVSKK